MDGDDNHASKRMRLATPISASRGEAQSDDGKTEGDIESQNADAAVERAVLQLQKERRVGITEYVSKDTVGFSGILKQRYTDFLVNEVLPDGQVLHLQLEEQGRECDKEVQLLDRKCLITDVPDDAIERTTVDNISNKAPPSASTDEIATNTHEQRVDVTPPISAEDTHLLHSIFGAEITTAIFKLHDQAIEKSSEAEERSCARKSKNLKPVHSAPISEKQVRTDAHQAIRRIFNSSLETTTDSCGVVILTAATRSQRRQQNRQANNPSRNHEGLGKLMWEQLGGEYLHFTLYKENKDTMEVLSYLASQLRINHKRFQFAGTKDRRAVTVQRMSVYRVKKEALIIAGRKLRNAQLSSFEYYQAGLELGQLLGNEFVITLRDCRFEDEGSLAPDLRVKYVQDALSKAVSNIRQNGFINYYGLQRFGTFSVSTDTIGTKILKGDYKGAVADILSPTVAATATRISDGNRSISWEDKARAEALEIWHTTHNATETLQKMPRKFSAELGIIRYLGYVDRKSGQRSQQSDFRGALQTIPRNLRLMYLHAYQSLVWNNVASFRWRQYGSRVVPGDLVLLNEHGKLGKDEDSARRQSVAEVADVADVAEGNIHSSEDQFGEVVVDPASTDSSIVADAAFLRARPLSKVEVDSSKYNILDIVLPLPGFDVIYPDNDVGKYYETLMSSSEGGAMDPHSMKRGWREASLSGGYRKFIAKPDADISATFERHQSNEKLVETDVDRLEQSKRNITISTLSSNAPLKIEQGDKVAVILRMQLSASQYATVALRELMKSDGVIAFQPSH